MPAYVAPTAGTGYATAIALTIGDTVAVVNNAATDSGITNSQQVNVEPIADGDTGLVGIVNNTNQSATLYTSAVDVLASYVSTSNVIAAGSSLLASMSGFLLLKFGTAPTTGSAYFRR